jgi:VWFA-related protein
MHRFAVVFAAGVLGLSAVSRARQDRPGVPPVFRGGIDIVQLDVTVLDGERRPVRGLASGDFTVYVGGQPRPVVAFRPVELPPPPPEPLARWMRNIAADVVTNTRPVGRVVAIVIDDGSFGRAGAADLFAVRKMRDVARAAVDELGPDDLGAVLFTENGHTSQNFTTDRRRLLAAIEDASLFPSSGADLGDLKRPSCPCGNCSIEALGRIADSLRPLATQRKLVVYASAGLPVEPAIAVPYNPIGQAEVYEREHCNAANQRAMAEVFRRAGLANVTIQAVDVRGLLASGGIDHRVGFLQAMAESTGGRAVVRTNEMERDVPALFEETSSYYLLGVAPPEGSADNRLHRVDVRVARPGLDVRTRRGFYVPTAAERKAMTAVAENADDAVEGPLPRSDLPLGVNVAPFADRSNSGRSALAIILSVTEPNRALGIRRSEPLKVVATAFNAESGRSVSSQEQTVQVSWNATSNAAGVYEVLSRLPLRPGRYEVRLGVEASSGRVASVFTYADVPDFSKEDLSLSGLVLTAVPAPRAAPADAFRNLAPVVPTARRRFRPTDHVAAFVRVYQARAAFTPAEVSTTITSAENLIEVQQTTTIEGAPFGRLSAADHRFEIPVAELQPGEYLLTVEVDAEGGTARRDVRFTID